MSEFLHDAIVDEFGKREIAKTIVPSSISDNLKKGFGERAYQQEALNDFYYFTLRIFRRFQSRINLII